MDEVLRAIEGLAPAQYLRASFYAYPLVNAAHILAIGALATTASLMDLRVLGLGQAIPVGTVIAKLRPVAVAALVVAMLTGFLLFSVRPLDYVANPAFRIKMLVLAAAVLNAVLFTSFRAHRRLEAAPTRVMAVVSMGLWITVLVAGRFIGFVE